jgi:hypothetical protein
MGRREQGELRQKGYVHNFVGRREGYIQANERDMQRYAQARVAASHAPCRWLEELRSSMRLSVPAAMHHAGTRSKASVARAGTDTATRGGCKFQHGRVALSG